MLKPSVVDLLLGVADTLAGHVAPALSAGPAADELAAAIGIIRRVARALPGLTPYLIEDIADLSDTLRGLGAEVPACELEPVESGTVPGLDALAARDLELRELLAGVAARRDLDAAAELAVVALLGRLNEREAALRLSPWAR